MKHKQKTLRKEVYFCGIGVHSGMPSEVLLKPAPCDSGIVFLNSKNAKEKIEVGKVVPEQAMHASVIRSASFVVSTVEHLMAAVSALEIDNLIIEIDGVEVPILDGSSLDFVTQILQTGIIEQDALKTFLTPKSELEFKDQDGRWVLLSPARVCEETKVYDKNLYFDYTADFNHPLLGQSRMSGIFSEKFFIKEIAPARTFGFLEQLPFLRRHGLAKGTTLGNTVVIGEEDFLNDRRFEDELVRHKLLDLFGDLALLGKNLVGSIKAKKTGHNFNRLIVQHYILNPDKWQRVG